MKTALLILYSHSILNKLLKSVDGALKHMEVFDAEETTQNYNHEALPQPVSGQGGMSISVLKCESRGDVSSLGGGRGSLG